MDGYPECLSCPRQLPTLDPERLRRLGWVECRTGWLCGVCLELHIEMGTIKAVRGVSD